MALDPTLKLASQARFRAEAQSRKGQLVPCSARGIRLGEHHHRAKLSDAQVDTLRNAYEAEVERQQLTDQPLRIRAWFKLQATAYGVSWVTVRQICYHYRRSAWPERWKRLDNQ